MDIGILGVAILHGALHILTNHQRTSTCILVPPVDQGVVISSLVAYLPIDLRYAVVEPAIIDPQEDVGIKVVVVLQTIGIAAYLRIALIAIDAKGRDTHLHPRLGCMDGLIELFDKEVHVITTPVILVLQTI